MPRKTRKKTEIDTDNQTETEEQKQEKIEKDRTEARKRLQLFLKEKSLERNSKPARNHMIDKLEAELETSKNTKDRKKIKTNLKILEKIADKDERQASEYPDYGDNVSYGGGLEHPD